MLLGTKDLLAIICLGSHLVQLLESFLIIFRILQKNTDKILETHDSDDEISDLETKLGRVGFNLLFCFFFVLVILQMKTQIQETMKI